MHRPVASVLPNYYNATNMYYYNPWPPVYYVGRSLYSVGQSSPAKPTSTPHHVSSEPQCVSISLDVGAIVIYCVLYTRICLVSESFSTTDLITAFCVTGSRLYVV